MYAFPIVYRIHGQKIIKKLTRHITKKAYGKMMSISIVNRKTL